MKIKALAAIFGVACLFAAPFAAEARSHCCSGFSLNLGNIFNPPPRVYEQYIVKQYSPYYYQTPVTVVPAGVPVASAYVPAGCQVIEPVYVVPAPRAYRRTVIVQQPPRVQSGLSFSWRSCR